MQFALVTFATTAYRMRQWFLDGSARLNHVADIFEMWNPGRLASNRFHELAPHISLSERGTGFWSWKPFVILQALRSVQEGDIVVYSDVGRTKVKVLTTSLKPFAEWMSENNQDCVPGVEIGWEGPMSKWTKRDAFVILGCDNDVMKSAAPIQASFSAWRNTPEIRAFVEEWLSYCTDRRLVSDDPNTCGLNNSQDFSEHRHDQAILTILCHLRGFKGLKFADGSQPPPFLNKSVEEWMIHFGEKVPSSLMNSCLKMAAKVYAIVEFALRKLRLSVTNRITQ